MTEQCDGLIIQEHCTFNQNAGRAPFSAPQGIVLWCFTGEQSALDTTFTGNLPRNFPTTPKAFHFSIGASGAVHQYVAVADTAWALHEYVNASAPLLPTLPAHSEPNAPWIHIGIHCPGGVCPPATEPSHAAAAKLICCLALAYNIPLDLTHILTAWQLDDRQTSLLDVPASLLAAAQACAAAGGAAPLSVPLDIAATLEGLEACCVANTNQIMALQDLVAGLQTTITALTGRVQALESWRPTVDADIAALQSTVSTMYGSFSEIIATLAAHQRCIDCVCPAPLPIAPIEYEYTAGVGSPLIVSPNVPRWLNAPTQLSDTNPPSVFPGALWTAALREPCNYRLTATVRLEASEYCAGKTVILRAVNCGVRSVIGTWTATGGSQQAEIVDAIFDFTVPPLCNDLHLEVETNDTTTSEKRVEYLNIKIACG